ncbi:15842_t:CDS:1 [Acaulospora colombiana]|uniref:15842_t:CDS:1 n=1 Tax=Acaulospora colombiana TaxID=27376 RepID=A0ACA9KB63_9GLOM|nr:15842_t:CDS:1 [Acaulospora colombiana]
MSSSKPSKSKDKYVKNKSLYTLPLPISLSSGAFFSSTLSSILAFTPFFRNDMSGGGKPRGTFDPLSNSVIVTNKEDIEKLWRQGFFGKGNLSRSEPTWNGGRGKGKELTAEQVTRKRRKDRERKKMRQKKKDAAPDNNNDEVTNSLGAITGDDKVDNGSSGVEGASHATGIEEIVDIDKNGDSNEKGEKLIGDNVGSGDEDDQIKANDEMRMSAEEHLQLTTEEAFFLCFGICGLDIYDADNVTVSSHQSKGTSKTTSYD